MGRSTSLTPEVQQRLLEAISTGNTREHSAQYAGICSATLRKWVVRGKKDEQPYVAFVAALKKAEAEAINAMVKVIKDAAAETWQAGAWWLERRYPFDYGRDTRRIAELEREMEKLKDQIREQIAASNSRNEPRSAMGTPPTDESGDIARSDAIQG